MFRTSGNRTTRSQVEAQSTELRLKLCGLVPSLLCLLTIGMLLAGCATVEHQAMPGLRQMDGLRDGITTHEEIVLLFGLPFLTMEKERVQFYRLERNLEAYGVRETSGEPWPEGGISLVLIMDEQGVLEKHSLVSVH